MPDDSLRASDADREATVARLQSAFAEGRLELAEIDERTAAAYAAKTLGDLAALTRDLPAPSAAAPASSSAGSHSTTEPATAPEQQQHHDPDIWRWAQFGLPPVIVISFLVWLGIGLSGNWVHPWWIWIVVAWLCGGFGRHRGHRDHRGRRGIERRRDQWERDRRREEEDDDR